MSENKDKKIIKSPNYSIEKFVEDTHLVKRGLKDLDISSFNILWEYCISNNRLCPLPKKWMDLYEMLKNKKQISGYDWEPSLPPVLTAWYDSVPIVKYLIFKEHIQWAADNNQIDEVEKYLRSLLEGDWVHYGEV